MFPISELSVEKLENIMMIFRFAMTVIGAGVILIGLVMFFYKPKEESKRSPYRARLTAFICFGLIGASTVLYAWIWFGK